MNAPPSPGGLFASLRRLAGTALDIARNRLELFGSEIEQEKLRLFDALVLAAAGLVMLGLALVLVVGFVVLLFQEGYRLPAVGVLALAFGGIGAGLVYRARGELRSREGGLFALTLGELRRDYAGLRPDAAQGDARAVAAAAASAVAAADGSAGVPPAAPEVRGP